MGEKMKNLLVIIFIFISIVTFSQTKFGTGYDINYSKSIFNEITWRRILNMKKQANGGNDYITHYNFKIENKGSFELIINHFKKAKMFYYELFQDAYSDKTPIAFAHCTIKEMDKNNDVYSIPLKSKIGNLKSLEVVFFSKKKEHFKVREFHYTELFDIFIKLESD